MIKTLINLFVFDKITYGLNKICFILYFNNKDYYDNNFNKIILECILHDLEYFKSYIIK